MTFRTDRALAVANAIRNALPGSFDMRFYYATQVTIEPPTFVLFASAAKSVHFSYQRFLENRIREAFDFEGTPLRIIFRERSRVELEPKKRGPKPTPRSKSGRKPTKKSVRKGS